MGEKKNTLRVAIKKSAAGTGPIDERALADRIEALPEFTTARTVALYHSLPDEVPTAEMLHRWLGAKRLALPVITGDGEMLFREYTAPDTLAIGAFGIAEPHTGCKIPPVEIDFMLVPGVAFDTAGRRLGRGGGFYDRYLSHPDAAHIYKMGLCRSGALVAEVPTETHDVMMDKIVVM